MKQWTDQYDRLKQVSSEITSHPAQSGKGSFGLRIELRRAEAADLVTGSAVDDPRHQLHSV
jgi:hypothetical protein